MMHTKTAIVALFALLTFTSVNGKKPANGETVKAFHLLDNPRGTAHGLSSDAVIIVDRKTIQIPNLKYDGAGPDAFFIVGTGPPPPERPSATPGTKIPNENGNYDVLKKYNGETITLNLPDDYTIDKIDWLAMYCIRFKHTFGYIVFDEEYDKLELVKEMEIKRKAAAGEGTPVQLGSFSLSEGPTAHGLRSDSVYVNDTKTIIIPNLHYDGKGPDAFFMVGYGKPPPERPSKAPGHKIPNEKGNCDILKAYNGETIVLRLPGNYTVNNIDWLAMYCIKYKHNFGHVVFKHPINVAEANYDSLPTLCGQEKSAFATTMLIVLSTIMSILLSFKQ